MAISPTYVRGGKRPTEDDFTMCRTIGHAWDNFYPNLEPPSMGWRFSLRCARCTSERHDIVGPRDGAVWARQYAWPDGYRLQRGVERPTRPDLRRAVFDRLREELVSNNQIALASVRQIGETAAASAANAAAKPANGKPGGRKK